LCKVYTEIVEFLGDRVDTKRLALFWSLILQCIFSAQVVKKYWSPSTTATIVVLTTASIRGESIGCKSRTSAGGGVECRVALRVDSAMTPFHNRRKAMYVLILVVDKLKLND
jgi:hypothetical protein